jgi:hypothetical protein
MSVVEGWWRKMIWFDLWTRKKGGIRWCFDGTGRQGLADDEIVGVGIVVEVGDVFCSACGVSALHRREI